MELIARHKMDTAVISIMALVVYNNHYICAVLVI
jgi:hypothetical protein